MSTVIVCLDGASNKLVRGFDAVFSSKQPGWVWDPSSDSLTALRTAQAMRRGDVTQHERRQVWEARQDQITETVTLWDLPQSIYNLAFLSAEEDLEPETFGRRALENKAELDALLNSMADAATICVAINGTALRMESTEATQRTDWLLRSLFRFAASLPCGKFIPLIVCDEDRPSTSEEEWLKTNLPLLSATNPAVLAIYERATKARQTLCKTIHECETWTPSSGVTVKPGTVQKALRIYPKETNQLQWPLAVDLLDDEQPLPDLNALKTDLDALEGFVKKTPVQLTRVAFQSWSATAPKVKTLAGKRLLEAVKKHAMDSWKARQKVRLVNGLFIGIVGLVILFSIVMALSTR